MANAYLVGSLVPDTGVFTLADLVNLVGVVTILVTLIESTVSLYLYDNRGEIELSRRFDRASFWIIGCGFLFLNIMLPLVAT